MPEDTGNGDLAERYTFDDALAVATYLNIFIRNCARVRMANLAQMVNAIAPIVTTGEAAARPADLLPVPAAREGGPGRRRRRARRRARRSARRCPRPPAAGRTGSPTSARSPWSTRPPASARTAARIAVTLVNRSPDAAEEASLVLRDYAFAGPAAVTTLTAADPARCAPAEPPRAAPARPPLLALRARAWPRRTEPARGPVLALTLPPRSFTVVEAPIAAAASRSAFARAPPQRAPREKRNKGVPPR